jgi:hypothetical protein
MKCPDIQGLKEGFLSGVLTSFDFNKKGHGFQAASCHPRLTRIVFFAAASKIAGWISKSNF